MTKPKIMKFRQDIQILRGISVLFVVFFHFGFESIKSGFLGVDVFFVISGFLMATLYDSRNKIDFFKRRAKRLFPAYYTTIILTLFLSYAINTPNESNQVSSQAIYGSLFLSNIGFWIQNSYFSKAEFNPLLHLWSLGVEIQFYLIVPLLAWFFAKSRIILPIFLICSLFLCFVVLGISPKTSFFMMPLRVWEFLIGYGTALYFTHNGNVRYLNSSWVGFIGLILILSIPLLGIDGRSLSITNGHPGLISLLISIATSLILVFGLPKLVETNSISNGLGLIGKYSYSIYLAHFPIIVLYLSKPFAGTLLYVSNISDFLILCVQISLSSILLFRFVEARKFNIWKLSFIASASIAVLALIFPIIQTKTLPAEEQKIFNAFNDRSTYRCGKIIRILEPRAISCELTGISGEVKNKLMLVGNSHADSIKTTFANIALSKRSSVHFIVENNPLMPGGLSPKEIVKEAVAEEIDHIVLHFSPSGIHHETISELVFLSQMEGIQVTFIDPVPIWDRHMPEVMYENLNGTGENITQTKYDYIARNEPILSKIDEIRSNNFQRIPIVEYFCNPDCMYKTEENVPLYFDSGHLTLTGSRVLKGVIAQIINELPTMEFGEYTRGSSSYK